ncbi:MAG: 50S ribosomal protein L3 [Pseudanabaenaceae cyanobacterium SKYGB_i_bin29]|nr:50S ribosomal protein L3 [Pseudanabaenaceae cyanobacterium SKYG29]MDW8422168.1 50S ribosomal protein L3 [Pseudanabaenaceae cyanobacterium SKYGB_i_bin29]
MAVGILGTKLGMTKIFDSEGNAVPVTVVQAGPCPITQIKTIEKEGYNSIQLGYGAIKEKNLNRPQKGHLQKAGVEPVRHLREFRVADASQYKLGQALDVSQFQVGQLIDVIGTSIGRGFAGYQKRHHFGRGPMSHGSKNHRLPGSVGAGTTPGRVFPGMRMAGRMGGKRVTVKKLTLVDIDVEKNLLIIKGAVPGKPGSLVSVVPAKLVGRPKQGQ